MSQSSVNAMTFFHINETEGLDSIGRRAGQRADDSCYLTLI
jgi:hypothetical protein